MHRLKQGASWLWGVLQSACYRFYWDDCFSRAAALAYTTLFALVPVTALAFSMFSVFGLQGEEGKLALRTILDQILPPMNNDQLRLLQEQVYGHLELFTQNVQALNTLSIAVLVFTAVALLNTVESALNVIWRTSSNSTLLAKLVNFWSVVTLGPLLIAVSIYFTTKVRAWGGDLSGLSYFSFSFVLPLIVTILSLTLLFYKLPAARVSMSEALLGAAFSALLFEFIKRGFAYYVGLSTTYSAIYGVVATIPIFLFWLYVTWCVILLGAEISYQAGAIHILSGLKRYATDLGELGAVLGLRILVCIGADYRAGRPARSEGEVAIETGSDPVHVRSCLNLLTNSGILSGIDERTHARSLIVAPELLTVGRILQTFSGSLSRGSNSGNSNTENPGAEFLSKIVRVRNGAPVEEWTLSDLLSS